MTVSNMRPGDMSPAEINPDGDRLERLASTSSDATSVPRITGVDQELERISRYEDATPLVPGTLSWGAHRLRSPTLDEPDEFITDRPLGLISNVSLPGRSPNPTWDVEIEGDKIKDIAEHNPSRVPPVLTNSINANAALLVPSLCHPHVHLDKAFLLSHPRHSHLRVTKGDFDEAMELTGEAKANFTSNDLIERGQRLIDESLAAGVTHMRAFVELDVVVGTKCLDAAVILKNRMERKSRTHLQICAFAQLPLFTTAQGDEQGVQIRSLMEYAAGLEEVEAVGSTPYVEYSEEKSKQNIDWITELAIKTHKHLDLHLDYNLDPNTQPLIWYVLHALKAKNWKHSNSGKTIVLGHCTRLTLFADDQWQRIHHLVGDLPVSFVGLPTSDLFMMRAENGARGTLNVPKLIKDFGLNACIGMNNIGNAFTPQGNCDPLSLASAGVGVYQAGTKDDADLLYQCVSTRARHAIGYTARGTSNDDDRITLALKAGDAADLVLFGSENVSQWRTRRSVQDAVYLYDGAANRRLCVSGRLVAG